MIQRAVILSGLLTIGFALAASQAAGSTPVWDVGFVVSALVFACFFVAAVAQMVRASLKDLDNRGPNDHP